MIERIPSLVGVRSEKTDIYVLANKAREAILGIDWHDIVGKAVAKILPAALGANARSRYNPALLSTRD
ncbi:hypothetical protein [Novosphingobium sp. FSW06-99]|uniref:hypothetical protein n=1 Tax=Novosphingobium sp. FSW06-99 TaxID=1739113 RepID=UPI00076DB54D|nr:hypothetical protein [Novosphingobium sp. FSW06-99]KUR72083.1 hypothetical protein AQZ49_20570 [Novosphingobium sp. FSW06-99]